MNDGDRKQFAMAMTALSELYDKRLSAGALALYWDALQPYEFSVVDAAIKAHTLNPDSGQWMPKPADILKMIGGTTQDAALVAWAKVDKAIRHVGTYASVVFDDPLIHRVLHDMGGWVPLGTRRDEEWPFVAREFENRYRGYRMRGEAPSYPRMLVGICEHENAARGLRTDPPVLVGVKAEALRVLSGGEDRMCIGFTRAEAA